MYTRNRYHRRRCNCAGNGETRNCNMPDTMPQNPLLANSYVPYQTMEDTFSPEDSLRNGTTFPGLVSPYEPNQSQVILQYLAQTETCTGEGGRRYE